MPPQTPVSRLFEVPCESFGLSLGSEESNKIMVGLWRRHVRKTFVITSDPWHFHDSMFQGQMDPKWGTQSPMLSPKCPSGWFLEMNKKKFPWISSAHEIIHIHLGHGNCGDAPRGDSDVSPRTTATSDSIGSTPSGDLFDLLVPTFQNSGCFLFPKHQKDGFESRKPRIPSRSMNNFLLLRCPEWFGS